jgi:hypothetical protein
VRQGPRELAGLVRECVNCGSPLDGPGAVARGPDTAWHLHCQACFHLVADELELVMDRPNGAPIMIYRCRGCGSARSCRPAWTTRCHVCLDERSIGPVVRAAADAFGERLAGDEALERQARMLAREGPDVDESRALVEAVSSLTLAAAIRRAERLGWEVLATDVCGLPWTGIKTRPSSHGNWGRHEVCGTVALLGTGAVDCPNCGPMPGSRTHRARRDDPYLLYLVAKGRWQKFGVGDRRRVETHRRGGAQVVQVLRAPFAQVMLAETILKQHHCQHIAGRPRRGMIGSFGQATEVTRRKVPINLSEVLPDGEDVTNWFC